MRHEGFTLIELMVALSIAVILLMLAAPGYAVWVADNQIRAGAQLIADGLRLAQAEAAKRNTQMEFVLNPTTRTGGWTVQPVGGSAWQKENFQGAEKATFTVAPAGLTTVTFTGIGTIATANADTTAPFTQVDVKSPVAGTRTLTVLVGNGRTGIKICDPAWTAKDPNDPKACPA